MCVCTYTYTHTHFLMVPVPPVLISRPPVFLSPRAVTATCFQRYSLHIHKCIFICLCFHLQVVAEHNTSLDFPFFFILMTYLGESSTFICRVPLHSFKKVHSIPPNDCTIIYSAHYYEYLDYFQTFNIKKKTFLTSWKWRYLVRGSHMQRAIAR